MRPGLVLLVALAVSAPCLAQTADWSRAGGDLFVRPPPAAPAPEAAPALADRITLPEQPFDIPIQDAAARYGLDPKLLRALVLVESGYRPTALSAAGAQGLTQLMPATAAALGVQDRTDPGQSLAGGAAFLARQIRRFKDVRLALAAYNAGPDRVAKLGRVPPIPETQAYVNRVVDCFLALTAGRPVRSSALCRAAEPIP